MAQEGKKMFERCELRRRGKGGDCRALQVFAHGCIVVIRDLDVFGRRGAVRESRIVGQFGGGIDGRHEQIGSEAL